MVKRKYISRNPATFNINELFEVASVMCDWLDQIEKDKKTLSLEGGGNWHKALRLALHRKAPSHD